MAHVMVIERNGWLRKAIAEYLVKGSHQVTEAEGAVMACDLAKKDKPDVILIDPEGDNYLIINDLRKDPICGDIPLLCRHSTGAFDIQFIQQPFTPEQLSQKIDQLLSKQAESTPDHARTMEPTLFIVDDEESIRYALTKLFTQAGYSVHTANSADEAVEMLHTVKPDAMIVDYKMPGMDGLTFLEKLPEVYEKVPTIFLTANADQSLFEKANQVGAATCLAKPYDNDVIVGLVQRILPETLAPA